MKLARKASACAVAILAVLALASPAHAETIKHSRVSEKAGYVGAVCAKHETARHIMISCHIIGTGEHPLIIITTFGETVHCGNASISYCGEVMNRHIVPDGRHHDET
ncbi:MAG: hypothetical protein ACYDCC_02650 [Actinomycetota bacterium]